MMRGKLPYTTAAAVDGSNPRATAPSAIAAMASCCDSNADLGESCADVFEPVPVTRLDTLNHPFLAAVLPRVQVHRTGCLRVASKDEKKFSAANEVPETLRKALFLRWSQTESFLKTFGLR
jgi:hypothetical protein